MPLFQHRIKLYYKRDQDQIDLSLMVSDNYVQTFYFDRAEFEDILKMSLQEGGYNKPGLFVFCKKEYLRWSFEGPGMTHQIRIERDKWLQLIDVYKTTLKNSQEPIITCVVT